MVMEIRAARAHVAKRGKVQDCFDAAAVKINANPAFKGTVTGRCINERYKRRMLAFIASDRKDAAASGVSTDVTAVEKLLLDMHNASESMRLLEKENKENLDEMERNKLNAAKRLMAAASGENDGSGTGSSGDEDKSEDEDETTSNTIRGRKRQRTSRRVQNDDSGRLALENFGNAVKETELAEIKFKERQLELEEKKHNDLLAERKEDRRAEKEREEARSKAEMEKFKLMLQFSMQAMTENMEKVLNKDKK